jgi:hypothetical protein
MYGSPFLFDKSNARFGINAGHLLSYHSGIGWQAKVAARLKRSFAGREKSDRGLETCASDSRQG